MAGLDNLGKLVLRSGLGIVFIAHGLLKILVFTLPGTAERFVAFGLPGWTAYPTACLEVLGGALLILGLGTRLSAILLFFVAAGAGWVHIGNGWNYTSPNGGWEYGAFLAVASVAVALLGPGEVSLSGFLARRRHSANLR